MWLMGEAEGEGRWERHPSSGLDGRTTPCDGGRGGVRRYCGKWKQAVKFSLVELNVGVEQTFISRINTGPECKQKTQTLEPLTDTG